MEMLKQEQATPADPLRFTPVELYTTFDAEFMVNEDNDITVHFFHPKPESVNGIHPKYLEVLFSDKYWRSVFPLKLDTTARAYFKAEYPRLQGQHVSGVLRASQQDLEKSEDSWWFKAHGFNVLEQNRFIHGFLAALDASLESFLIEEMSRT